VQWIDLVHEKGLEGRVLHATSAGNDGAAGGLARAGSVWSAAGIRDDLRNDAGAPVPRLQNTLSVENVREATDSSALTCLNPTSNSGGTVAAPGKSVYSFDRRGRALNLTGTSQASPVIAGVATYLWSIAPDLSPQQVKTAIVANPAAPAAGCARPAAPALDAYRAVLSLDQPGPPTPAGAPVRMAILDLNNDHSFTEADLQSFVGQVKRSRAATHDWSRFDLNGDGFTGGTRTSAFDLDRTGSVRAGASLLGDIKLAGATFHESSASDEDVLCYYTYSGLYTGDAKRREQLLDPKAECGIEVDPAQADENCTATTAFGEPATIMGGPGDDKIEGTSGDDVIVGGAGKDQIEGFEGNDRICGGSGNDEVRGGGINEDDDPDGLGPKPRINSGDDLLDGGDGTDRVHGTGGSDRVYGGPGDGDTVLGGSPGSDFMDGGPGLEDSCFRAEIPIDPHEADSFGPGCELIFGF
jgi:Ca2+-binding RTX toxin-like protein